jgi:hypothetical protein
VITGPGGWVVDLASARPRVLPVLRVLSVLVPLVAVAVAAIVVWGYGADPITVANHVTVHDLDPRRPYPVVPPDALRRPGGPAVFDQRGIITAFESTPLLTTQEKRLLAADGTAEVEGVLARPTTTIVGGWDFTVRDASDPARLVRDLDALYRRGGYAPTPSDRPGVAEVRSTAATLTGGATVFVAHYRHDRDVLRVVAYGPDPADVAARFDAQLAAQLARSPVGG